MTIDCEEGLQKREIRVGPVLEVESVPPRYIPAVGPYQKSPSLLKVQHTNVGEHSVQLWRTDAS